MIFTQPASRSAHDQYSPTTHCIVSDLEEPIRAGLFGVERLEPHADSLTASQVVFSEPRLYPLLTPRVLKNSRVLLESYRIIARAIQHEHVLCCCPPQERSQPEMVIPKTGQDKLADMVGTTRSRISFFMNKFRNPGFIDYNLELHVRRSPLNIVLHA